MPTVTANGIEIYYERAGAGPVLLFISGSGGDLRQRPSPFDSALGGAFDLICYDQRGLGRSGKPVGCYSMADYADDAAALLDALGLDRVPVIGVSFGGMVAQELALRHPHRVQALVLACTSSGGAGGASYPLHELEALPDPARAEAQLRVSDLRHTDMWIAANPATWQRRVQRVVEARRDDRDEAGARRQLEARRGHDTFDRLGELSMPVLLVGGEHDGIAPPANMMALHAAISQSELRFFDGGHLFMIQDRDTYPFIIQWVVSHI